MKTRTTASWSAVGAFFVLALSAVLILLVLASLDPELPPVLAHPLEWLRGLDATARFNVLFNAADVVAGVLAIAITVSAIIVELAANRYNHRITLLFVSEPVTVALMSLFVVTTLLCIWTATMSQTDAAGVSNAAFVVVMTLVSASLLALLPYFVFLFAFLSPLSIIEKITDSAYRSIRAGTRRGEGEWQRRVARAIDELHDVARSAIEQSDRGIAMGCVDAFAELLERYSTIRESLPAPWFEAADVAADPDFISLAPGALQEIDDERIWLEVKVFRQYISLLVQCVPRMRDVANLVGIDTRRIGTGAADNHPALLTLCIRSFNSYLRMTINAVDLRTSYYLMNQYRLLAEELVRRHHPAATEIARHFRFYGQIAHRAGQSFLLEVAAYDLVTLVETAIDVDAAMTDDLLGVLLELDQEIRSETQEESLLGVRRAQIQLATLFLLRSDAPRAQRIVRDLRGEKRERLDRIRVGLETEQRSQYWELNDRGVNFGYLPPERRATLQTLFQMLG